MAGIRETFQRLSPSGRNIVGNTGWLMADRVVRLGLGLFVGVWVARYLGPVQFGSLSFALAFVALFATITTLGLEGIVVRHIVLDASDAHQVLGTAFALRMGVSVFSAVIAVATVRLLQPGDPSTTLLVGLLSVGSLFQAFDTIDCYFQSQVRSRMTVLAKNSAFLIVACLRVGLIHLRAPLWTFAAAQTVEFGLGACGLVLMYGRSGGRLSAWRASRARAKWLLAQSWPVLLSGMAIMIYMRIDVVMLKLMQGDAVAGVYATATRISEVWYFIPAAIVSSVAPSIMRAKYDSALYYGRIERLFNLMSLLSLSLGSAIALSSKWIVHVVYSDAFVAAGPVLAVHVWASAFVFLGIAQGPWDLSQDLLKLGFYRTVAGAASNVLLNFVLIPKLGALGAAISTVISYAISAVIANAFSAKTRRIFLLQLRSLVLWSVWHRRATSGGSESP
jgi:PST family polysaccharide transporter